MLFICLCLLMSGMSFFFTTRRRHTRFDCDWSSDVCSSDLIGRAFFFQAEDGIRDLTVTGVQTCALPISFEIETDRLPGGVNFRALHVSDESFERFGQLYGQLNARGTVRTEWILRMPSGSGH